MKEHFGYTEPFRRFVQHETFSPQANEIPNTAASWLPGDDYYVNFHEGDPFIKVEEGYDQVLPSCRTHNTSRARAGSSLHCQTRRRPSGRLGLPSGESLIPILVKVVKITQKLPSV